MSVVLSHATQLVVFYYAAPGWQQEPHPTKKPSLAETPAELFSGSLLFWWWEWSVERTGVSARPSAPDTPPSWAEAELRPDTDYPHRGCQECSQRPRSHLHSQNQSGLWESWLANAVCKALGMLNPSSEYSKGLNVSKQLVPTSCSFLWHSWMLNPWPRLMPVSRSSLNKHLCNHSL